MTDGKTAGAAPARAAAPESDPIDVSGVAERARVIRGRWAIAAVFAVHGAVTGNFATRVPWIQDHAGIGPGQLGVALAFPAIGASLAMPLAAAISHRLGARLALRILLSLWTLALALPSLAPNLVVLCVTLRPSRASRRSRTPRAWSPRR